MPRLAHALALATLALTLTGCTALANRQAAQGRVGPEVTVSALESIARDTELDRIVAEACRRTLSTHRDAGLGPDRIWAAVIDVTDPARPRMGAHRPDDQVYPASVIKIVFMAHVYERAAAGELPLDRRTRRLLSEMIRVSSNVATQRIVDLLSGVTDGPSILEVNAYNQWTEAREGTNRWMRSLGFERINANQKTWDELPAENSVERQFLGGPDPMGFENGNRLTVAETAALMWLIHDGLIVGEGASEAMRELLHRGGGRGLGDDAMMIGAGMPRGTEVFYKGGSTGRFYHDTSFLILPDGRRLAIALFTEMQSSPTVDRTRVMEDWGRHLLSLLP